MSRGPIAQPVSIIATDEIHLPHTPAEVYAVLRDFAGYPRWWPWAVRVRVLEQVAGGVGTNLEIRPFGGQPFECRVEAMEEPHRIRMIYHRGLVRGRAEWVVRPEGGGVGVAYEMDARGEAFLVRLAARVVSLRAVHSWQMRGVLRGLRRELAARATTG